jgi:bacteriorhodopsin
MASGEGWIYHYYTVYVHEGHADTIVRQLYWIRYFDWVITTSLILRALTVLAGLSGAEIFFTIVFDVALIFCVCIHVPSHIVNN